jgi:2-methylisocitrate lyase-like PEP mutase family enzyme
MTADTPGRRSQAERGEAFRQLHRRDGAFIIPNPFDAGTARLLESLGFEALATTSSGFAATLGRTDNSLERELVIEHMRVIAAATDLPVNGDLEDGFGPTPEAAAETIRLGAEAGLAGGSIEDSTNRPGGEPLYEVELAAERVRAAVEAAAAMPFPFTLTARAENFLVGRPELGDAIRRLQAYQEAGADVLYAPGLRSRADIASVVSSVDRPVNVVMGLQGVRLSVTELSELGVRRISVGSALSRAALGAFLRAAREMRDHGTFGFADEAVGFQEISELFADGRARPG